MTDRDDKAMSQTFDWRAYGAGNVLPDEPHTVTVDWTRVEYVLPPCTLTPEQEQRIATKIMARLERDFEAILLGGTYA